MIFSIKQQHPIFFISNTSHGHTDATNAGENEFSFFPFPEIMTLSLQLHTNARSVEGKKTKQFLFKSNCAKLKSISFISNLMFFNEKVVVILTEMREPVPL